MKLCEGSGQQGLSILRREHMVECGWCLGQFHRQAVRGYWLIEHTPAGANPDPELPFDDTWPV